MNYIMPHINYPIRINKYLALNNYCSRREADKFIEKGLVKINRRVAILGDKVSANDKIEISPVIENRVKNLIYIAYNKPLGIVTHGFEEGQKSIRDILKIDTPVFPVGRLDKNSHGLIILTNDGRLTDKLLNPLYDHEKEYVVKTDKDISSGFLKRICSGVEIEGYKTKKCRVEEINERSFRIALTEGKKHQIRRMCAALGYGVVDLERVRIMNIGLGNLRAGAYRKISGSELSNFLKSLGL